MKIRNLLLGLAISTMFPIFTPKAQAFDIRSGFADLVEELEPAVINVFTTQEYRRPGGYYGNNPFDGFGDIFQYFFGIPQDEWEKQQNRNNRRPYPTEKRQSLGSGFIITDDGYALTNYHVVENATKITIKMLDEREYSAKIIGSDKETDVALIKIEATGKLPFVKMGNSDKLRIGDWVLAIGNPFGLNHTVTAGIVSAKERIIGAGPYDQFIQTDASINPGNSGGPLFNLNGEVVGINTAIMQNGQGLGFAIPINVANNVFNQLRSTGKVSRGWLGVAAQELTPELADGFGQKELQGALISQVFKESPAEKAGLKNGDIITAINGKKIHNPSELTNTIGALSPGEKVEISIVRDSKKQTIKLELSDRGQGLNKANGQEEEILPNNDDYNEALEVEVANISRTLRGRMSLPDEVNGVVITDVDDDSPFYNLLRKNDVVISVNKQPIAKIQDFTKVVRHLKKGQKVLFHIWRNGGAMYIATRLPE